MAILIDSFAAGSGGNLNGREINNSGNVSYDKQAGAIFQVSTTTAITSAKFWLSTDTSSGGTSGTVRYNIYAATGTVSVNAVPTGPILASSNSIAASSLNQGITLPSSQIELTFPTPPVLAPGNYAVVVDGGSLVTPGSGGSYGGVFVAHLDNSGSDVDNTTNVVWQNSSGGWQVISFPSTPADMSFEVYGNPITTSDKTQTGRFNVASVPTPTAPYPINAIPGGWGSSTWGMQAAGENLRPLITTVMTDKAQTGVFRVYALTSKIQTGKFRTQATTTRTQTGRFRLQATTDRAQTGTLRVQATVDRSQSGQFRTQVTNDKSQSGVFNVYHINTDRQLVKDPSFEINNTLNNVAWSVGAGSPSIDTTVSHTGSNSAKIVIDSSNTNTGIKQANAAVMQVSPNTNYVFSIWGMSSIAGQLQVGFRDGLTGNYLQPDGSWASGMQYRSVNTSTAWSETRFSITTSATQTQLYLFDLKRSGLSTQAGKTFWVDDVEVWEGGKGTQTGIFTVSGNPTQNQTGVFRVQADVSVDQTGVFRVVSTTDKIQTGKFRVYAVTSKIQTGKFRLQATTDCSQSGIFRVYKLSTQDQTGQFRVSLTSDKAQTGRFNVQSMVDRNQTGKFWVFKLQDRAQTGQFRVSKVTDKPQSGKFTVFVTTNRDQGGVFRTYNKYIGGGQYIPGIGSGGTLQPTDVDIGYQYLPTLNNDGELQATAPNEGNYVNTLISKGTF